MSNKIILKKSSVGAKVPVVGDLEYGELALNYADGKLYFKNSSNTIQSFSNDSNNPSNVTLTGTQTLTNKTIALGSNTISGTVAQFNSALTDGDFATLAGAETLTNKTLTAPVIATIVNTGTLTLPTSTDTLVGRATTDTLTNKTLTSPTINGGSLSGTFSGAHTYSGVVTLTDSTASTTTATGALKVSGGVGVAGNIYTGGKVGFVNASNVSAVYQFYNTATGTLDTVFG
jgi:hypothetical protein